MNELVDQTRLADTRLARDPDDLSSAKPGPPLDRPELLELGVTADEAAQPAKGRRLETASRAPGRGQLVRLHRRRQPLHRDRPEWNHVDVAFGEGQRLGREKDLAGVRELLHPGREVGRLPHRGIVHVQIVANRADDHLAGVEAYPNPNAITVLAPDLLGKVPGRLLNSEGGIAGSDRMILVRQWRAEERHDPITHDLVDRALVEVNGFHHEREHRVENRASLLWIAIGQELHRALHVREENGHLLALSFQDLAQGEDLLS